MSHYTNPMDNLSQCRVALQNAHQEIVNLKAKIEALVTTVDTEIDNIDHENYPLCGVYDGSRMVGRHPNGSECTCGVQRIRDAIAAARGGAS